MKLKRLDNSRFFKKRSEYIMINNIEMKYELIQDRIAKGSDFYWVKIERDGMEVDVGCFEFGHDEPNINEVLVYIGDEIRLIKSKRWNNFFSEKELYFLKDMSLELRDIEVLFIEMCNKIKAFNEKNEPTYEERNSVRQKFILNVLKSI